MGESQDMTRFRSPPADSGSQLSQSQRDWVYAKRALARGLREEEVLRNTAEVPSTRQVRPAGLRSPDRIKAQIDLQRESRIPTEVDSP